MITLMYKCTNTICEDGQINENRYWKDREPKYAPCSTCSGTGQQLVNVSCSVMRDVNMGDHGETRITTLDAPDNLSLHMFLKALFNPADYRSNSLISVSFSAVETFMAFNNPKDKVELDAL